MQFSTILAAATWVALSNGTPIEKVTELAKCISSGEGCENYSAVQAARSYATDCTEKCKGNTSVATCIIQECDNKQLVDAVTAAIRNSGPLKDIRVPDLVKKGRGLLAKATGNRISKRELERRGLRDLAKKAKDKTKELGSKVLGKTKQVVKDTLPTFKNAVKETATNVGRSAWESTKEGAKNAVNNASQSFDKNGFDIKAIGKDVATGAKNDFVNGAKDAGRTAVDGAKAGAKDTLADAKENIKNVVKGSKEATKEGEDSVQEGTQPEDPAEEESDTPQSEDSESDDEEIFEPESEGLDKRGLGETFRNFGNKAKSAIGSSFKENVDNIKNTGKTIVNAGVNTVKDSVKDIRTSGEKVTVSNVGKTLLNNAKEELPEVGKSIKNTATSIGKGVVNNLKGRPDTASTQVEV